MVDLMLKPRAVAALVALSVTTVLAACTPNADAGPSPTPSSSNVGSSSPTPSPEPVAASVTISADSIAVLDDEGGTLASFDYFQPAAEVVSGLGEFLGASVDSPYPGGTEMPPGTNHEWGGLRLVDTDAPVAAPYYGDFWVIVTTADANGLPIGTPPGVGASDGVHVGDAVSSVTIGAEPGYTSADSTNGRPFTNFRIGLIALPPGGEYGDDPSLGVTVVGYTDTDTVDRLIAPARNWGP